MASKSLHLYRSIDGYMNVSCYMLQYIFTACAAFPGSSDVSLVYSFTALLPSIVLAGVAVVFY